MAGNSSSSNDSLIYPDTSFDAYCFMTRPTSFIFTAFTITNILLILPLCLLVLYLGLQRWRRHCSTSAAATTSHSDSFTYHIVAMELIAVFGCVLCCWGIFDNQDEIFYVGFFLWNFTWFGETFFHILTCVERYVAVVHPVTFLSLRRERGIRIRNISIFCVWLLSFGTTCLTTLIAIPIFNIGFLMVSLIIIFFCSLSVLCVLIRPGPGEQGRDRERVDQLKKRAFYTITAILVVLLFRFSPSVVWTVIYLLKESVDCVVPMIDMWFNFPSNLVLPLLFLHRAGTLTFSKNNT